MTNSDIAEHIRTSFRDRAEPLWFPRLVEPLAQIAWDRLQQETGLTPESYSTNRLFYGDPEAKHDIAACCRPRLTRSGGCGFEFIPVEILAHDVVRKIIHSDVRLLGAHSIANSVASQLDDALSVLNLVPTVWPTVCQLVRALHVIDSGSIDHDVSFSDPMIPFSVFVSVPPARCQTFTLRVAEAILHESMHLNLTLTARAVPLVRPQGKMYYSPWRHETRDSEGMIQALYVFGVIMSFFSAVPVSKSRRVNDYVAKRREEIKSQMKQAQQFRKCDELTPEGSALVARLLNIAE